MTFRKKHHRPAQNKNEAKALRRKIESDRPSLRAVYPNVERLTIGLSFLDRLGVAVETRSLNLNSDSLVDFDVDCIGMCGNGRMALGKKIESVIQNREVVSVGQGKCAQPLYAGSPETCGYGLKCHIEVVYRA